MNIQESSKTGGQSAPQDRKPQAVVTRPKTSDSVNKQLLTEIANKEPFGPPRMNHITGKRVRGDAKLTPWVID